MNLVLAIPLADTWGMHGDVGWGWMASMMIFMVLFWGAVVFGIVWLIRAGVDRGSAPPTESPTDILERRFAEGAISVDEYQARREVLVDRIGESNGAGKGESVSLPHQAGASEPV